jgi:SAM-dependent methyltransferase
METAGSTSNQLNTMVAQLQDVWEALAHDDPLWAILSDPEKTGGRWDLHEFFASGEADINSLLQLLAREEIEFDPEVALDFGCGVGRLTQPLAARFNKAYGVDISPQMVRMAQIYNRYPDRCYYIVNAEPSLRVLADNSVSFIYSMIALQHIPPPVCANYLRDFVRILKPGGLLAFQLSSHLRIASPMSDLSYRADLDVDLLEYRAAPGEKFGLKVKIFNRSESDWIVNAHNPFAIGNHWLAADATMLQRDDGRTRLPQDLPANSSVTLDLMVTAPNEPGEYLLELDMVHEGVAWFAAKGSPSVRIAVHVEPAPVQRPEAPAPIARDHAPIKPVFGMHAIHRREVTALLDKAGAFLEFIERCDVAPGFESYRYFARKRSEPDGTVPSV